MENVVRKYFDGVNKKDPDQIRSCFGDEATICDVVVSEAKRTVQAQILTDRCMDFLAAHPDCSVNFHYGYVADFVGVLQLCSANSVILRADFFVADLNVVEIPTGLLPTVGKLGPGVEYRAVSPRRMRRWHVKGRLDF